MNTTNYNIFYQSIVKNLKILFKQKITKNNNMDIPNRVFEIIIDETSLPHKFLKKIHGNYINFDSTRN